jgi:hypothetical protein
MNTNKLSRLSEGEFGTQVKVFGERDVCSFFECSGVELLSDKKLRVVQISVCEACAKFNFGDWINIMKR